MADRAVPLIVGRRAQQVGERQVPVLDRRINASWSAKPVSRIIGDRTSGPVGNPDSADGPSPFRFGEGWLTNQKVGRSHRLGHKARFPLPTLLSRRVLSP